MAKNEPVVLPPETYNGWSNRATWNVSLWLNNDEPLYKEKRAVVQRHMAGGTSETGVALYELCMATWKDGKTPDGDQLAECDWSELALAEMDGEQPERPELNLFDEFAKQYEITMDCHRVPERPDRADFGAGARHFRCHIKRADRSFGLYFSQGSAHIAEPTIGQVLEAVKADAQGYESAGRFEVWAREYGYDSDSRTAERIFKSVKRQAMMLKRCIGQDAYKQLLEIEV